MPKFLFYPSKGRTLFVTLLLVITAAGCTGEPEKPDRDSEAYRQAVSDFYVSLAAVQSDQTLFALDKMQQVADAFPREAAAWANLGVYSMRQGAFDAANERLNRAAELAPDNADILFLAGLLESRRGNIGESIESLERALKQDSGNPRILFALADELERQDADLHSDRITELLNRILQEDPDNLAVLLETVRTASKWKNRQLLEKALSELGKQSANWPDQIRRQFLEQRNTILEKEGENMTFELAFLRNNLNQLPEFRQDLSTVQIPPNQVGFLITEFLWLPDRERSAAPPDTGLNFREWDGELPSRARLVKPVGLADEETPGLLIVEDSHAWINGRHRLRFPDDGEGRLNPDAVGTFDYNYDFLNDIVLAGENGLAIYRQQEDSSFTDVTGDLDLPARIRQNSYNGVWSQDIESDGDLDLLLSPAEGGVTVLRNNGDDTFGRQKHFDELEKAGAAVKDMLWADFDIDGDPDALFLLEDGSVRYFENERTGRFEPNENFGFSESVAAVAFGDLDGNGLFEVVALTRNGIEANRIDATTRNWTRSSLIGFEEPRSDTGESRLFVGDLDNNSALDIIVSWGEETGYWLNDETLTLRKRPERVAVELSGLADMNGDTRLDLLGFTPGSKPAVLTNSGSLDYKARLLRPRASGALGDRRINSFGIGGEIEARSGVQYSKQPILDPWVHIGLGTHEEAEMVRIIWPNGSVQAEFAELGYDSKIMNEQILKGSCPWVFTHNGERLEFVADFLWRTALGLRINAQGDASVIHSIDWIKIDGDQLKPRGDYYDVRITADLWETHFFDHVSLMAVDHPEHTEVFVDERFILPAPEQKLYPVEKIFPVGSAADREGNDLTGTVRELDGDYVDGFGLTSFQGVADEHYLEVSLGEGAPEHDRLWLIASGWVYPTDSSINIAISQGDHAPPQGIRLEVPDGKGGWKTVRENAGFPAGKNKTMLIDLEDIFEEGAERRVRLHTNMEIYWDRLQLGVKGDASRYETEKISAETARLRYRGFSKVERPGRFLPEIPDYRQITGTAPRWFDLKGFYTRFGEVGELTREIDDRYVIMNAGDELVFEFPALPDPPEGWKRDYVLIGDGWVKDGDLNTGYSKTVLPLPYHGMEDYSEKPGRLQDDPVYQKHPQDWADYHTRYVTPDNFIMALQFQQ